MYQGGSLHYLLVNECYFPLGDLEFAHQSADCSYFHLQAKFNLLWELFPGHQETMVSQ